MPLRNEVVVSGDRHLNLGTYSQAAHRTMSSGAIWHMIGVGKGLIAPLSFPFRSATLFLLPQSEDSVDGVVANPA